MTVPLPVNIDSSYADSGTDPTVALHQQYHDRLHGAFNARGRRVLPSPWVGGRNQIQVGAAGSNLTAVGTSRYMGSYNFDVESVRVVYNHVDELSFADANPSTAITIKCGLEPVAGGAIYQVTFNGRRTVTLDQGYVISDPISVKATAGQLWACRTYISSGTFHATASTSYSGEGWTATTDLTNTGAAAVTTDQNTWHYGPVGLIGMPREGSKIVVLGSVGDSMARGDGDTNWWFLNGGPVIRSNWGSTVTSQVTTPAAVNSLIQVAVSSGTFANWNTGHWARQPFIEDCTSIVCSYGVNDVKGGTALATLQANAIACWRTLAHCGAEVFQTTITPVTTSTDTWATTTNQAVTANETLRVNLNTWIRAGAPVNSSFAPVAVGTSGAIVAGVGTGHPLVGYFDWADAAETARNSGIWKAGYTTDGTHGTPTSYQAMANTMPASSFTPQYVMGAY